MRRSVGTITTAGFALAVSAWAAEREAERPPARFEDRVEVRLVQVDAWATASGEPVLDLKQSELQLSEDGRPVDILYFAAPLAPGDVSSTPSESGSLAAPAVTESAAEPAVVALFLDDAHLGLGSRARTIAALREWVAGDSLPAHADAMLVAFDGDFEVLMPRTRDRARLLDALDRLGPPSTAAVTQRMNERRALDQIREHQRNSIEQQRDSPEPGVLGGDGAAASAAAEQDDATIYFEPPCSGRLLQYAEELADTVESRAEGTLESLADFADSLAALRGRKLLVFVSEGMPSRPGGVAFDFVRTLCDGSGARAGIQYAIDIGAQARGAMRGQIAPAALALAGESRALAGTVEQVVARANSSGVSVWTFGARGLTESGTDAGQEMRTSTPESQARQHGEAEDVLNALAADTGGRAILQSNDLTGALDQLADDLSQTYSIAFASPRAGDGRLHKIKLETTRPGVRLRYRRSWRDASTEEELANLVGGALSFGIDRPGLGAVATIGRQKGQAGEQRLILRVTLPREALTPAPDGKGGGQGWLRLAIALLPAGGDATPIRTRTIKVETQDGGGEPIVQDIALPEIGRGALVAIGLRDEVSGEIGVFRLEVGGS